MSFDKFFDAPKFDEKKEKEEFIKSMNFLRSMTVEEQTFYKKWYEIQHNYKSYHNKAGILKANVWRPTNILDRKKTISEIQNLNPVWRFIPPEDTKGVEDWTLLRVFVSSFNFDQNPGRFLRFLLIDENTNSYLGIASLASDVINIACRDNWIGWTNDQRRSGMLNYTAIGSTIVSTQPFGYNFLGGKLIASMLCSKFIKDIWEQSYNQKLIGITTTSLYGSHSMYQRIPFWKELGKTTGKIPIKPDYNFYEKWHKIVKEKYPEMYKEMVWNDNGGPATGVKQKIVNVIFKEVGLKPNQYIHGFERGVYFAPLYENFKEFLRKEISEDKLIPSHKLLHDRNDILNWWKEKAIRRYENLLIDGRINAEVLFYNSLISMSWNEAKKTYLHEVGR